MTEQTYDFLFNITNDELSIFESKLLNHVSIINSSISTYEHLDRIIDDIIMKVWPIRYHYSQSSDLEEPVKKHLITHYKDAIVNKK